MKDDNAPPAYQATDPEAQGLNSQQPFMAPTNNTNNSPFATSDDFDYSTKIASCSPKVRKNFQAKVYTILSSQLLLTLSLGCATYKFETMKYFFQTHIGFFYLCMFVSLIACFWIALSPNPDDYLSDLQESTNQFDLTSNNLPWYVLSKRGQQILLGIFTLAEAYTLTTVTLMYDQQTVLSAILITTMVVLAVTMLAVSDRFQMCFETMNSIYYWMYGAVWLLIAIGFSSFIFGWNSKMNLIYGWLGAIVFTIYLFVDTQLIFRKVSLGDEIKCAMMLYLDIINLFLSILRILSNSSDD
ncbi:hypothetical protein TBLA_0B08640 [Henningerozyma blattae CBS 6284]|uniref:Bax inhibitor 1 n=1 Tax=Henningerozyma blattae (strain ATCC 34711 / CBS 6284 / DSM 70876 / NBRC 10599 / NRRL Y-10934 / UCD 77-7) TaxID=1071380 RepID=I2GZX7_HENB6|nr:hypothetical protein TBLA_0B08640 [Tetrapisispora blattae CBS 6284]CCH59679.1 hypothetical protein TBLA_0B08640 [Tetrapisispora blattae CBS 6284]